MEQWVKELENLCKIAETQPHAAYAAFTHGLSSRWNYLLIVIDWEESESKHALESLENTISSHFIPALTGQPPPREHTRELLALPARLGGLELINPTTSAKEQRTTSQQVSAPLGHQSGPPYGRWQLNPARHQEESSVHQTTKQNEDARELQGKLPANIQHSMELSQEKGASTWLTALPIKEHGFVLPKAAFRESLALRYGWPVHNSPSHCSCGQQFSVEHALTCKTGGFPVVRQGRIQDL